jgi:hypothetical protein
MFADYTSYASVIIALATCAVLIWQLRVQRKHNKLSVSPHLEIWMDFSDNRCQIYLENYGIGPAKITAFEIFVDNKKIVAERHQLIPQTIKSLFSSGMPIIIDYKYAWVSDGFWIPVGRKVTLVGCEFQPSSALEDKILNLLKSRVELKIQYESIYGKKDSFNSKEKFEKMQIKYESDLHA